MGVAGNGANGNNMSSGVSPGFDLDGFGISGMDDFTAMFRDDFERDFGAWFTTGGNGDDPLESIR